MPSPKTLWNSYKGLKWYWKVLLGVFFLAALILVSFWFFVWRVREDVTNEEVVQHSKAKTDAVVENFETDERRREQHRQELKTKRQALKDKMEKRHEEHVETVREIDGAASAGDLIDIAARLRERNRDRQRRSD